MVGLFENMSTAFCASLLDNFTTCITCTILILASYTDRTPATNYLYQWVAHKNMNIIFLFDIPNQDGCHCTHFLFLSKFCPDYTGTVSDKDMGSHYFYLCLERTNIYISVMQQYMDTRHYLSQLILNTVLF